MDRHLFLAAPWDENDDNSPTLSVYFDISTGHYECDIDNKFVATIRTDELKQWIDTDTGEPTNISRRAGELIDKRIAE
jgi:hypothetical protein